MRPQIAYCVNIGRAGMPWHGMPCHPPTAPTLPHPPTQDMGQDGTGHGTGHGIYAHQSMKQVCKKYEISMKHVKTYLSHICSFSYMCHTLGFQRVLGALSWAGPGSQGAPHRVPGPPQGAKDPLEAQSMTKVCNKYEQI